MKSLTIEITDQCYNNCKHCSSNSDPYKSNFINKEKVFEIIRDATQLGFDDIAFSGGEPFLHLDLHEMIQYSEPRIDMIKVYTSGVTKDQYGDPISLGINNLRRIKDSGLSKLIIGLQTLNKFTYDRFCCSNNFDVVMKSINNAVEVFRDDVELNVVPNKLNINELEDIAIFAHEKGMGKVNFLGLVIQGRANDNCDDLLLSKDKHEKLINDLDEISKKFEPGFIRIGNPLKCGSCDKCMCGIEKIVITPTGFVHVCESMKNIHVITDGKNNFTPDNIYEKSLMDIYTSSIYLKEERKTVMKYSNIDGKYICPIQREAWY